MAAQYQHKPVTTGAATDVTYPQKIPHYPTAPLQGAQRSAGEFLPAELPEPYQKVFGYLQAFVRASTMDEHIAAVQQFAEDLVWDAPPILVHGRDNIRVIAYLAKTLAHMEINPLAFKVEPISPGSSELQIYCEFYVKLNRAWWLPLTYLVPDIPIMATLKLRTVKSITGTDKIQSLWGRIHNFPVLPALVRKWNALCMGNLMVLLEPYWSKMAHLPPLNDPSYLKHA